MSIDDHIDLFAVFFEMPPSIAISILLLAFPALFFLFVVMVVVEVLTIGLPGQGTLTLIVESRYCDRLMTLG